MNEHRPSELYALLVPLDSDRLLVPRGCVAEVVGYQTPQQMPDVAPWYLGVITWNGRRVPLVSFEGAAGGTVAPSTARSRVVILNALSAQEDAAYLAVLSQGFPQLVRISPELVKLDASHEYPDDSPVVCRLHMLNESPLVPDLDRLEAMVEQQTPPLSL
jgi:chemosensory pili system protein ChpC